MWSERSLSPVDVALRESHCLSHFVISLSPMNQGEERRNRSCYPARRTGFAFLFSQLFYICWTLGFVSGPACNPCMSNASVYPSCTHKTRRAKVKVEEKKSRRKRAKSSTFTVTTSVSRRSFRSRLPTHDIKCPPVDPSKKAGPTKAEPNLVACFGTLRC